MDRDERVEPLEKVASTFDTHIELGLRKMDLAKIAEVRARVGDERIAVEVAGKRMVNCQSVIRFIIRNFRCPESGRDKA